MSRTLTVTLYSMKTSGDTEANPVYCFIAQDKYCRYVCDLFPSLNDVYSKFPTVRYLISHLLSLDEFTYENLPYEVFDVRGFSYKGVYSFDGVFNDD